jgi:hypothetical protein
MKSDTPKQFGYRRCRYLPAHNNKDHTRRSIGQTRGASMSRGLSDTEVAMVRHKVEQHVPSEIIEARDATAKALKEVEQGWRRAQDVIAQRAGLVKGSDGSWGEPVDANAAA